MAWLLCSKWKPSVLLQDTVQSIMLWHVSACVNSRIIDISELQRLQCWLINRFKAFILVQHQRNILGALQFVVSTIVSLTSLAKRGVLPVLGAARAYQILGTHEYLWGCRFTFPLPLLTCVHCVSCSFVNYGWVHVEPKTCHKSWDKTLCIK